MFNRRHAAEVAVLPPLLAKARLGASLEALPVSGRRDGAPGERTEVLDAANKRGVAPKRRRVGLKRRMRYLSGALAANSDGCLSAARADGLDATLDWPQLRAPVTGLVLRPSSSQKVTKGT